MKSKKEESVRVKNNHKLVVFVPHDHYQKLRAQLLLQDKDVADWLRGAIEEKINK